MNKDFRESGQPVLLPQHTWGDTYEALNVPATAQLPIDEALNGPATAQLPIDQTLNGLATTQYDLVNIRPRDAQSLSNVTGVINRQVEMTRQWPYHVNLLTLLV